MYTNNNRIIECEKKKARETTETGMFTANSLNGHLKRTLHDSGEKNELIWLLKITRRRNEAEIWCDSRKVRHMSFQIEWITILFEFRCQWMKRLVHVNFILQIDTPNNNRKEKKINYKLIKNNNIQRRRRWPRLISDSFCLDFSIFHLFCNNYTRYVIKRAVRVSVKSEKIWYCL